MRELGIAVPAPRAIGSCVVSALVAITGQSKAQILKGLREIRPDVCTLFMPGVGMDVVNLFLEKNNFQIKSYCDWPSMYPKSEQLSIEPTLEKAISFIGDKKGIVAVRVGLRKSELLHAVAVGNGLICDNSFAVPSPYNVWKRAIPYTIGPILNISMIEKEPE